MPNITTNHAITYTNRIFEKLIYWQLKNFPDKNDILFKSQYCFREKDSTQHAVIDIVNIIQNNMDLKLFTCGISWI